MNSALTRVKTASSAAKLRMRDAFKNESGAFDLPSIIVGVVVVGILTAGVLAAIFGVIPFAQDKAAQQDLGSVTTAQGVYMAQVTEGTSYAADLGALKDADLIGNDVSGVYVAGDADSWASLTKSESGDWYKATSAAPKPVPATAPTTDDAAGATTAVTDLNTAIPSP